MGQQTNNRNWYQQLGYCCDRPYHVAVGTLRLPWNFRLEKQLSDLSLMGFLVGDWEIMMMAEVRKSRPDL